VNAALLVGRNPQPEIVTCVPPSTGPLPGAIDVMMTGHGPQPSQQLSLLAGALG
jgi:hypothetical protein